MADKGKWIYARYAGRCAECNAPIAEGDHIGYIFLTRAALCADCAPEHLGGDDVAAKEFVDKIFGSEYDEAPGPYDLGLAPPPDAFS